MNHATQVELLRKALELLEAETTDMVPEERRLPAEVYTSEARLDAERRLLRSYPVVVADASELREPGSFVTHDRSGVPVVVRRDESGELRAFVNACRHRGARLVKGPSGRKLKGFVCPYHAWCYDAGGRLVRVPGAEAFPSSSGRDLAEVPVTERFGLVWVRPDPGTSVGFDEHFAPLAELDGFGLDSHASVHPYSRRVAANWKLVLDLGLEAYHVRSTHATSIYQRIFHDDLAVVDRLGPHVRIVFPRTNLAELRELPESGWDLRRFAYVGYLLFPNTSLLIEPDHVLRMTSFPEGVGTTHAELRTLVPAYPTSEKEWANSRRNRDLMDRTLDEDFAMGESITRGLGAGSEFLLGRNEQGIHFFHDALEAALAGLGPGRG